MKNKKINTKQLVFMALCISLGLVCKQLLGPFSKAITDVIHLPGGGINTALPLMFLVIGGMCTKWLPAASVAGFVQALIAMALGLVSGQGIFTLITFTVPGIVIDIMRALVKSKGKNFVVLTSAVANAAGAWISNVTVFHFTAGLLALWMLVSACSGALAGLLGAVLFKRLRRVPGFEELRKE